MKESVYGWYPTKDPWRKTQEHVDTYANECLYRHHSSLYHPSCNSPDGANNSKLNSTSNIPHPPSPPSQDAKQSMPSSVQPIIPVPLDQDKQTGNAGFEIDDKLFRSRKAWSMKLAETSLCGPINTNTARPDASAGGTVQGCPRTRSQSAVAIRPRAPIAPRTVKSARPHHRPLLTPSSSEDCCLKQNEKEIRRLAAPTPVVETRDIGVENPLDYDEQLKIHGWKMEIPGDPLNLKRPCIAKRLPTSVTIEIPRIPQNPLRGHMESYETFFYNTLPRAPLSFTIHPDWASELINAKRMERQKRDGSRYLYRTTNFSFAY